MSPRTDHRFGDVAAMVRLQGTIHGRERGWDAVFEAYVAGMISEFTLPADPQERLRVTGRDGRVVGCVASGSPIP